MQGRNARSVVAFESLDNCDHVFFVQFFVVHKVSGLWNVVFQDRKKDERGDTTGKSTVVEHQATVQSTGCRAHGSTHKTCCHTGAPSVASGNWAEAGGKGHGVYVALGCDRPADFSAIDVADGQGEQVK